MIRYIPFLKAKRGELTAMGELASEVKQAICPFFDFPRKKGYDPGTYSSATRSITTGLKKHWGSDAEFYFDDLDIGQQLNVDGGEKYAHVLGALHELRVIPVVAIGRTTHNGSVAQIKRDGEIVSDTVAFRVERADFEDFDVVKDEIKDDLGDVLKEFDEIDLIFDCRVCTALDVSETGLEIATFAKKFCAAYSVRRLIVTGSCIPASIRDVVATDDVTTLPRRELELIAKTRDFSERDVLAGDYATVSPFYSDTDLDPKLFQKVMTPRLIYPFKRSFFITRGSSLQSGGPDQYVDLTKELCGKDFFRRGYSLGEDYFSAKSKGIGKRAMNGTVVKPSVVAHITYMVLGAKF